MTNGLPIYFGPKFNDIWPLLAPYPLSVLKAWEGAGLGTLRGHHLFLLLHPPSPEGLGAAYLLLPSQEVSAHYWHFYNPKKLNKAICICKTNLGVGLQGNMVILFNFERINKLFSIMAEQFYIPLAIYESSNFSTFWPTFMVFLNYSIPWNFTLFKIQ